MVQSDLVTQFVDGTYDSLVMNITTNCCDSVYTRTIDELPTTEYSVVVDLVPETNYYLVELRLIIGDTFYIFTGEYNMLSAPETFVSDFQDWILNTFGQTVIVNVVYDTTLTITIENLAYPVEIVYVKHQVGDGEDYQTNYFSSIDNFSVVQTNDEFTVSEAVYHVEIIATAPSGSTVTQKKCFFYDCTLACEIGEFILDNCNTDVHLDYYVLKNMEYCECNCDNMCLLYKRILDKLNKEFCCGDSGVVTTNKCTSC